MYKFVCDLKALLGYSPKELAYLVKECAMKKAAKSSEMRIRSSLGLSSEEQTEPNVIAEDDDDDADDPNAIALQTAVNNLSQLSASVSKLGSLSNPRAGVRTG